MAVAPWLVTLLLIICAQHINGEVFTAVADMEGLVETEYALIKNLEAVVRAEEDRIKRLKSYLAEYESIYEEASKDISKYLANPINAYLLVKRLTADLSDIENLMISNAYNDYSFNVTQLRQFLTFPTTEDLNGAAVALTRLQDMYLLETPALAQGVLQGKKYSRQLTAGDCFELGRQLYNNYDYNHSALWLHEALKIEVSEVNKTASRFEILEYLEFTTFKLGKVEEALTLANEALKIDPDHVRINQNKINYQDALRELEEARKRGDFASVEHPVAQVAVEAMQENKGGYSDPDFEVYHALCRGEKLMDPRTESKLRCRYVDKGEPFLFLQPVKEEEANHHPRIVIYHDVIYDSEIATIKSLAQPRFERAIVVYNNGEKRPATYRIAKSAFIEDELHHHIDKVSWRIGLISGLDMRTAEILQVVNYGIGGQYEPHHDHADKGHENMLSPAGQDWGNRIATFLFYMTDVEAGGATVFPKLNVALWPRKGSAAFWYNLYPSSEGDDRTRHASCPVLTGSKWICNKWIHERGQEFRRPCRLHPDIDV